jgi:hypothetical protein
LLLIRQLADSAAIEISSWVFHIKHPSKVKKISFLLNIKRPFCLLIKKEYICRVKINIEQQNKCE